MWLVIVLLVALASPASAQVCTVLKDSLVWKSDKGDEFHALMKSGNTKEGVACCLACMVDAGNKVVVTDAGWTASTVKVIEGKAYDCVGDMNPDILSCK